MRIPKATRRALKECVLFISMETATNTESTMILDRVNFQLQNMISLHISHHWLCILASDE